MMKTKNNSAKLKGTVLYTVVSVLMVLIVFLMGTLALAATASNRAYTNYQKEQTEYTARAVLDAVMQTINADEDGTGLKLAVANVTDKMTIQVTVAEPSADGTGDPVERTYDVVVTKTDRTINAYNPDGATPAEMWTQVPVFQLSVNVGTMTTTAETTYSTFIGADVTTEGDGGGAFVTIGDLNTDIGTGGYITGDGVFVGIGHEELGNYTVGASADTLIDAPIFVNGHLTSSGHAFRVHFSHIGNYFAVAGDLKVTQQKGFVSTYDGYSWGTDDSVDYSDVPLIYVGESFYMTYPVAIGSEDVPTNLFCADFTMTGNSTEIYGDVYAFDPHATSSWRGGDTASQLYEWVASNIGEGTEQETLGNMYSAGNVFLDVSGNNKIVIDGDLRVEGDLTISGSKGIEVSGDIVCGGKLNIVSAPVICDGDVYASTLSSSGTINATGNIYVANNLSGGATNKEIQLIPTESLATKNRSTWYDDISVTRFMPGDPGYEGWGSKYYTYTYTEYSRIDGVVTSVEKSGKSNEYWNAFVDHAEFEEFLNAYDTQYQELMAMIAAPGEANAVVETIYDISSFYGAAIYPDDYRQEKVSLDSDEFSLFEKPKASKFTEAYPTSLNELDTSLYDGGEYRVPVYNSGDLEAPDGYYEITSDCVLTGDFDKNIYINPGASNPITVILENVEMTLNSGASIVVNDDSEVILFVCGTLKCGNIITEDYLNLIYNGSYTLSQNYGDPFSHMANELHINKYQPSVDSQYYPNVQIYGEDGSRLEMHDQKRVITAFIRAPKMDFWQRQTSGASKSIYYYPTNAGSIIYGADKTYSECDRVSVIGGVLADTVSAESADKWGLIYVTLGCDCGCEGCIGDTKLCECCGDPDSTADDCCGDCICGSEIIGGGGSSKVKNFEVLYYNIY